MYSALVLAGFAALAAANPAPQAVDFIAVAQATVTATGPPLTAASQTDVYNTAAVLTSASNAVSSLASASGTPGATAPAMVKRTATCGQSCFWFICWGTPCPSTSTTSTTSASKSTSTSSSSPAAASTSTTSTISIPGTSTTTTSSTSACPTTPEAGTYCGFINPEDPCAPQPDGYGPKVTPDTVNAFYAYAPFHTMSENAVTPAGYVQTFKDLNASSSANSYLGLQTLTTYSPLSCSQWCDNTTLCTGFNLYIERDPSLNPSDNCTNVSSITNYKCTLWGSGVSASTATNTGGWRNSFQVVIVGSNGYEKSNTTTPATPSGWTNPQNCSSHAHNHASTCVGTKFFPGPYNPAVCASYASAQNSYNARTFPSWASWLSYLYNPVKCNFFNAYMLKKDGRAAGTYCSLYAKQYNPSDASYIPGWNAGSYWGVETSWSFCSS